MDTIPLGVDTKRFKPRNKRELREAYGLPQDACIILWVGRISHVDKADLLPFLYTFKKLKESIKDKKLLFLIAGRFEFPGYAKHLKDLAGDLGIIKEIFLLHNLNLDENQNIFALSDIFISPADNVQESFGITPIEAMACGIPQIVSDWNGYKDTVAHNETGFRIPTYMNDCGISQEDAILYRSRLGQRYDHLKLAQTVIVDQSELFKRTMELIRNKPLYEKFAKNSRRRALQYYDWKKIIKSYDALWNELSKAAAVLKDIKKSPQWFYLPSYIDTFRNYPTHIFGDKTQVVITKPGKEILEGKKDFPTITRKLEEEKIVEKDILLKVLRYLQDNKERARITKVLEDLGHKKVMRQKKLKICIMWLLKYGFLSLNYEELEKLN